MKTQGTIERELRRILRAKRLAGFLRQREVEDWLYGAEVALSWALGQDTMAPVRAFGLRKESA